MREVGDVIVDAAVMKGILVLHSCTTSIRKSRLQQEIMEQLDEVGSGDSGTITTAHIVSYLKVYPPDPCTQWITEATGEYRSINSSSEHNGSGSAAVETVFGGGMVIGEKEGQKRFDARREG
ncbi:hypothetical protein BJ742DRAFT_741261 [Cladochytrium replicatum]|nr:hypothetical protein BJ742DRAFT_741261 [Cladochytrium replicatum]